MGYKLTYKPYGEHAVLIEWPKEIDTAILNDLLHFKDLILKRKLNTILEVRTAYNSLLVIYRLEIVDFNTAFIELQNIYQLNTDVLKTESRLWKIPVCYDSHFGIDLEHISEVKNCSEESIITGHFTAIYTVYFIGFLPGFLYLGGLDSKLFTPRKSTPRLKIEKGAVAIGGNQTGIYPQESPGGWNVIGNSPITFFDPTKEQPCFAMAGDKIQFYSISLQEYNQIKTLVEAKVFQLESEVLYD
ncbi:5-oxoprolinase subunit PxpB [Algibacter amylolyticus]|uniref:5-oxoprolinase subunit PxpB n=1 Tax=Algibacter amylolyticus TaxID=1608400 RepID=UPI00182D13F6|nr:5-oxoprolinase subunit PxpB [Algibacter amylolyticus]MBB5269001.1 inhibitor of KinA [Algibacter amylolyticus]